MSTHPVGQPVPMRLSDEELVGLGAFLRGASSPPSAERAESVARIGVKITTFFMSIAKVAVEHYDREALGLCSNCWACMEVQGIEAYGYVLCPTCGNKRCPKASNHRQACTGSNDPGQPGAHAYPPRVKDE